MTEYPDDEIREALRAARARQRAIPRDVVVPDEISDEQLLAAYDDLTSGRGWIQWPGEVEPDADGIPSSVAPATSERIPAGPPEVWFRPEHRVRLDRLLAERDNEETTDD